jgi:hypothetical protein
VLRGEILGNLPKPPWLRFAVCASAGGGVGALPMRMDRRRRGARAAARLPQIAQIAVGSFFIFRLPLRACSGDARVAADACSGDDKFRPDGEAYRLRRSATQAPPLQARPARRRRELKPRRRRRASKPPRRRREKIPRSLLLPGALRGCERQCAIDELRSVMVMSRAENPHLILAAGTQIVALVEVRGGNGKPAHPRGAAGVVVQAPRDWWHAYRVRFPDGLEASLARTELAVLAQYKAGELAQMGGPLEEFRLFDHVIFRCVIGSRAYGLEGDESDTDRRGVYLPPAEAQWSLYGVPEQLENHQRQETYWELQKFLTLALKANPNILECLYSPIVEHATDLAREMIDMRASFLSKIVYQTYNGYVMSQFKKLQADLRNKGEVKWKHVMHLIRLLIGGVTVLREGYVPVRVEEHREKLMGIRRGEVPFQEVEAWRLSLHREFDAAEETTKLPDRPDYERANDFLIKARRSRAAGRND